MPSDFPPMHAGIDTCAPERPSTGAAPELLAPAGGPEPFYAALAAGADAIYCGMGSFNARRKAANFTDESFEEACRAAHIAGARVYVTVNIVIKDAEMPDALELIRGCAMRGADAFIIQDWGLLSEVRRLMPQIEIHVSTQANVHDARGVAWCRELGAGRVTLSRELSLPEIEVISREGVELEVFTHGAICFCYSGVCLLSSFACAGRSANRGMCAQPCRLPYELLDERGRVIPTPGRERALCPRDNCTIDLLPELLACGTHAFKLEGRMKSPDYVHSVTRAYREGLDEAMGRAREGAEDAQTRARRLKRCFNRDFTSAYQQGTSGDEMMSYERSNNRGQIVGEVVGSRGLPNTHGLHADDRRARAALLSMRLDDPVCRGDLLEVRHDEEFERFLTVMAPADAQAGSVIEARAARPMPAGSTVRVIRSQPAMDEAAMAVKRPFARKRGVAARIRARLGEPFAVELSCIDDPALTARAKGFTVEAARTRAITARDLIDHVGRMGSSPFEAVSFDVELDEGCGMGFSAVHEVRARACRALADVLTSSQAARTQGLAELRPFDETALSAATLAPSTHSARDERGGEAVICAIASSLRSAEAAREAGAGRVYMSIDHLIEEGLTPRKARLAHIIPILDEVCREGDHARIDRWIAAESPCIVANVSELAAANRLGAPAEIASCIPVHNVACMHELERLGATGFWLSPELTLDEIARITAGAESTLGIAICGKPRVMTSEHCILQVANACIDDCERCRLRRRDLSLRNIDGKVLPIRTDPRGRSHLYDGNSLDLVPQLPQLLDAGITRFMVDGTLLDAAELARLVQRAAQALASVQAGLKPPARLPGSSARCLFVGVH